VGADDDRHDGHRFGCHPACKIWRNEAGTCPANDNSGEKILGIQDSYLKSIPGLFHCLVFCPSPYSGFCCLDP